MFSSRKRFLLAVSILSATLLAFEILAIRFMSIIFYPIAAYIVISLALLGFGMAGGYLSVRRPGKPLSPKMAAVGAAGYAVATFIAFLNIWFATTIPWLLPITLALPFACGGFAIAVSLSLPSSHINQVYFSDLLGAGIGAILLMLGLLVFGGGQIVFLLVGLGFVSAGLFHESVRSRNLFLLLSFAAVLAGLVIPFPYGIVPVSPKELARMLELDPAGVWEYQSWHPLARIDVISLPEDRSSPSSKIL